MPLPSSNYTYTIGQGGSATNTVFPVMLLLSRLITGQLLLGALRVQVVRPERIRSHSLAEQGELARAGAALKAVLAAVAPQGNSGNGGTGVNGGISAGSGGTGNDGGGKAVLAAA